jgi:hypothetical protein
MSKSTLLSLASAIIVSTSVSAVASNLVVNGDFAAGNSGFTSQYTYSPGNLGPANVYDVGTNPQADNGAWPNAGPPAGAPSPNMLIVNGGLIGTNIVWGENNIAVQPNTNYFFSVYIENLYPVSPATLAFSIDGASLGNPTAGGPVGIWVPFFATWYSGANTTANLALIDTNTAFGGNDFALDLICLSSSQSCAVGTGVGGTTGVAGVPEPSTWAMLVLGFAGVSVAAYRRSRKSAFAISAA